MCDPVSEGEISAGWPRSLAVILLALQEESVRIRERTRIFKDDSFPGTEDGPL